MAKDRIILVEDMGVGKAIKLIKTLPTPPPKKRNGYKFVFTENKEMIIGRAMDKSDPKHGELGTLGKDKIAGYVLFTINQDDEVTYVYLNNQSRDFRYPAFETLRKPQLFLTKLFGDINIDMEDKSPPNNKVINLPNSAIH